MKRTLLLLLATLSLLASFAENTGVQGAREQYSRGDRERLVVFEIFTRST